MEVPNESMHAEPTQTPQPPTGSTPQPPYENNQLPSRMVKIPSILLAQLKQLAEAKDFNTLSASAAHSQLQIAKTLATDIMALPCMGDEYEDLQTDLVATNQVLANYRIAEERNLTTIDVLSTALKNSNGGSEHSEPSEKHPDPDRFDGTRSKLRGFLGQLRLKLGDRRRFPSDQDQLRYAASRLEGPALDQVLPYLVNDQVNLDNLGALILILENAFDDPDRAGTAQRKLRTLRQGNRDFASYYAEFQRYAPETGWDNIAKMFTLREGLSRELQTALVTVDEPNDLPGFVLLCQRIDQKLRRLSQKPSQASPPRSNIPPSPATPSTATGTHAGPMDLSSVRRKLTPEEKALRMREGRCYYCGNLGHLARECSGKTSSRPWHASATSSNSTPSTRSQSTSQSQSENETSHA